MRRVRREAGSRRRGLDQRGSDRVEGSTPEGEAMEEIRQRLELELNQTMERIRQLGGAAVI